MKKALSFILTIITIFTTSLPLCVLAQNSGYDDIVLRYSDIFNCVVDGQPTAKAVKDSVDGEKILRVTPDTESALFTDKNAKKSISLDSWGLDKYKIDFTRYRYVTVEYKYTSPTPVKTYPKLHILPQKVLTTKVSLTADDELVSGRFASMTFYIHDLTELIKTPETPYISQLHLFPFGDEYVNMLSASDEIIIGKITFSVTDPKKDRFFTVSVDGKQTRVAPESSFTLPKNAEKDGYEFKGYIPGSNAKILMQPGECVKIDKNITFTSYYVPKATGIATSDIVYGNFKDYFNCIVDGLDTGFADKDGQFLTARAHPYTKNLTHQLKLDGWEYGRMRIAPSVHNYAYVVMKVDGADNIVPSMNIMKSNVFSKIFNVSSSTTLKNGEWCVAEFDISALRELLIDEKIQAYVKQIHFLPFGKVLARDVPFGAMCYLDKIIFSKERLNPTLHDGIINGYPDGTFKPEGNITRAEAASLVLRVSGLTVKKESSEIFPDVKSGAWYYDTVNTLALSGVIDATEKSFRPDEKATRAELTDMVYRLGIKASDVLGSFSDLYTDHKYYDSVRKAAGAGIIGGYGDGTFRPDAPVTRAEAAKIISNLIGRGRHVAEFDIISSFPDVPYDHWCSDIIKELCVRHIVSGDDIICTDAVLVSGGTGGVSDRLIEEGNARKAEVDALFEERKRAILESPTEVTVKGTKYYVSNSGDDSNDGLSPETPWRTVNKVNNTKFSVGDGVFFRRGDLWREQLMCDKGVTYSAYGDGAKPRFYGSPENGAVAERWTLVEGTDNIWKYHLKMRDVGGIVIGGGECVLEKVAPRMIDGIFYNVEDENVFNVKTGLVENGTFFSDIPFKNLKSPEAYGYVYLRLDEGNPGEVFDDIEFITTGHAIYFPKADVVIDNLCTMYAQGGINGSNLVINATIQNCEVGYIGGVLQGYDVFSGTSGNPVRYGNGINFYGACDGYYVYNNYVHDVYDAGISNQYEKGGTNAIRNDNIEYSGNIIERCCYGIEYFMGVAETYVERIMTNMHIHDNIIRDTGYGFGRKNPTNAAAIKGWDHNNHSENFTITNNIFCDSYADLYHIGATYEVWLPVLSGNIYIQHAGRTIAKFGKIPSEQLYLNYDSPDKVRKAFGESDAQFYFIG
ncbi:MAG: S-layer homology domain-containing protein [Clostridia bacterium]|nr:S-layer homology domain-containing protein [Clostridia bacterium]